MQIEQEFSLPDSLSREIERSRRDAVALNFIKRRPVLALESCLTVLNRDGTVSHRIQAGGRISCVGETHEPALRSALCALVSLSDGQLLLCDLDAPDDGLIDSYHAGISFVKFVTTKQSSRTLALAKNGNIYEIIRVNVRIASVKCLTNYYAFMRCFRSYPCCDFDINEERGLCIALFGDTIKFYDMGSAAGEFYERSTLSLSTSLDATRKETWTFLFTTSTEKDSRTVAVVMTNRGTQCFISLHNYHFNCSPPNRSMTVLRGDLTAVYNDGRHRIVARADCSLDDYVSKVVSDSIRTLDPSMSEWGLSDGYLRHQSIVLSVHKVAVEDEQDNDYLYEFNCNAHPIRQKQPAVRDSGNQPDVELELLKDRMSAVEKLWLGRSEMWLAPTRLCLMTSTEISYGRFLRAIDQIYRAACEIADPVMDRIFQIYGVRRCSVIVLGLLIADPEITHHIYEYEPPTPRAIQFLQDTLSRQCGPPEVVGDRERQAQGDYKVVSHLPSVLLSPLDHAVGEYVTEVLGDVERASIMKENGPNSEYTFELRFSYEKIKRVHRSMCLLDERLKIHLWDLKRRTPLVSEGRASQEQQKSIARETQKLEKSMLNIRSCKEVLAFNMMCFEWNGSRYFKRSSLDPCLRDLANTPFLHLASPAANFATLKNAVIHFIQVRHLFRDYRERDVVSIPQYLDQQCLFLFSEKDKALFNALVNIGEARILHSAGESTEVKAELQKALACLHGFERDLDVEELRLLSQAFADVAYHEAAFTLIIEACRRLDPTDEATQYYNALQAPDAQLPPSESCKLKYEKRLERLRVAKDVLVDLKGMKKSSKKTIVPKDVDGYRTMTLKGALDRDDRLWHYLVYEWFLDSSCELGNTILKMNPRYLQAYLWKKWDRNLNHAKMLAQLHRLKGDYLQAAVVWYQISQSQVLGLSERKRISALKSALEYFGLVPLKELSNENYATMKMAQQEIRVLTQVQNREGGDDKDGRTKEERRLRKLSRTVSEDRVSGMREEEEEEEAGEEESDGGGGGMPGGGSFWSRLSWGSSRRREGCEEEGQDDSASLFRPPQVLV